MKIRVEAVAKTTIGKHRGPIDLEVEIKEIRKGKRLLAPHGFPSIRVGSNLGR